MAVTEREIEALYISEKRRLEQIASKRVGISNGADVVQDVFAAIWTRAREHLFLSPSYLSRAIQYASITRHRAEQRRARLLGSLVEEQYVAPAALPDQIVAGRQELARLQDAFASLPERTRKVFLLNRLHGCTYDEIAIGLGISYSTVEREMAKGILCCRSVG